MISDGARHALSKLDDRDRTAVTMRCGLDGFRRHTFKEIGAELGVTLARARVIVIRAQRRLRRPHLFHVLMTDPPESPEELAFRTWVSTRGAKITADPQCAACGRRAFESCAFCGKYMCDPCLRIMEGALPDREHRVCVACDDRHPHRRSRTVAA